MSDHKKKKVIAISTATYRGVSIYETKLGFGFFLGIQFCAVGTLPEATRIIDGWYALKAN